ncbi:MAG: serine hydrolase [Deltaproteobacteria bacterium]|nr:serine hydrolase [Deltaproteobacteria bacterium]
MFVTDNQLFIPKTGMEWEQVDPRTVGWDATKLESLKKFAGEQNSSSLLVLHQGKILAEKNWEIAPELGGADNLPATMYQAYQQGLSESGLPIEDVASTQKGFTAVLAFMAQERGLLDFDDSVTKYLGTGWTLADEAAEKKVTIRHLLTMTTGLDAKLEFDAKPGTKWVYNTPAYQHLIRVIAAAAKMDYVELTHKWLTQPLGMSDTAWIERSNFPKMNKVTMLGLATTARDLGKLGLLVLVSGSWEQFDIVRNPNSMWQMIQPSQDLNPAYGHLWYANGQSRYIQPPDTEIKDGPLWPAAPEDTVAALGHLGRSLFVCPSLGLVVVRLGYATKMALEGDPSFNRQLWEQLMDAAPAS